MVPQESPVAGVVVSVSPNESTITIRRYTLLGALRLKAETYSVASRVALRPLRPGDRIVARYSNKDGRLHQIRVAKGPKPKASAIRENKLLAGHP
jgi:hypothetical protein